MLLITAAGVYLVGKFRPEPISSRVLKEKFWADKVHATKKYDIILTGDSRLYRGVDPQTVSKKVNGAKVLNFGFSSGGHNSTIFEEVTNRLNPHSKLRAIILVLTPYSLTPKAQKNEHFKQEKNRDKKDIFNRRYVNPLFHFLDPIKPSEIGIMKADREGYYERFQNNGWVASWKNPANKKEALEKYVKNFEKNIVDTNVLNEIYNQTKLWTEDGIRVFAIRIPSTFEMETLENNRSHFQEEEIKRSFNKAGGKWITIEDKADYFSYDGSHLEMNSAIRFSNYLGEQLKKELNN